MKLVKKLKIYKENKLKEIADKQIRNSIILEKIEQKEKIKPTEEDINKEFEKLAKQFRVEPERIKEFYMKNQSLSQELLSKVANNKIFDFLIENAKVNYKDKTEENGDEAEKKENEEVEK